MGWEYGGRRIPEGLNRTDAEWMADGACRNIVGTPVEVADVFFLSTRPPALDRALFYCRRCRVRTECADYAWDNGIEYGVWGGVSEHQRRAGQRYMVELPPKPKPATSLGEYVLQLHRSGMKWRAITRETGLHARTIYKLIQQHRERAS